MQKVFISQKFKPEIVNILFLLNIEVLKNFLNIYKYKKNEKVDLE